MTKPTIQQLCLAVGAIIIFLMVLGGTAEADFFNPVVEVDEIRCINETGRMEYGFLDDNYTIKAKVDVEDTTPGTSVFNMEVTFYDDGTLIETVDVGTVGSGETVIVTTEWYGREPTGWDNEHNIQVEVETSSNDNNDNNTDFVIHELGVRLELADGEEDERTVNEGGTASYWMEIENTGTLNDTYNLNNSGYNPNAWDVWFENDMGVEIEYIYLEEGEMADIFLKVKEENAEGKDVKAEVISNASSQINGSIYDTEETTTSVAAQILIVDAADTNKDSVTSYYEDALDEEGYSYNVHNNREDPITAGDMSFYSVVIWVEPDSGLSQDETDNVTDYLDEGDEDDKRSLFISGKDIAEHADQTTWGRKFLRKYMEVEFSESSTSATTLQGRNHPVGGNIDLDISLGGQGDGARNQDHPDNLTVGGEAEADAIFEYYGSDIGGTSYEGDTYNSVFFSFGFEGINSESDRFEVMARIMRYFQGGCDGFAKDSDDEYIEGATVELVGTQYTTETDPKGYYFFTGVAPGEYTVRCRAEGYEDPEDKEVTISRGTLKRVSTFILQIKPAEIQGVVTNRTDQPVENAKITFKGKGTVSHRTYIVWTDFDGEYDLEVAEGTYDVNISKQGHWPEAYTDIEAEEGAAATWANFTVYEMQNPGNFTGYIDYDGTPLEGLYFKIFELDNITVYTNEDGIVPETMVPGGNYTGEIRIMPDTFAFNKSLKKQEFEMEVTEGETIWVNRTLEAGAEGTVMGRVTDNTAEQKPLRDADIEFEDSEDGTILGVRGDTDSNGDYSVEIPIGYYNVTASKPGYATKTKVVRVREGEEVEIDFKLPPGETKEGHIQVNTTSNYGDKLADVAVTLQETEYVNEESGRTQRASDGSAASVKFQNLPLDSYTIVLDGYQKDFVIEQTVSDIVIEEDGQWVFVDVEMDVILPIVSGTISDQTGSVAIEGATVRIEGMGLTDTTDSNGEYSINLGVPDYNNYDFKYEDFLFDINVTTDLNYKAQNQYNHTAGLGDETIANFFLIPGPEPNRPPTADAGGDQEVYLGDDVILDGTDSEDEDGYIETYTWNIDGANINGETLTYTLFDEIGDYEVTLTVVDNEGAEDTDTITISIVNPPSQPSDKGDDDLPMTTIAMAGIGIVVVIVLVVVMSKKKPPEQAQTAQPAQQAPPPPGMQPPTLQQPQTPPPGAPQPPPLQPVQQYPPNQYPPQ